MSRAGHIPYADHCYRNDATTQCLAHAGDTHPGKDSDGRGDHTVGHDDFADSDTDLDADLATDRDASRDTDSNTGDTIR